MRFNAAGAFLGKLDFYDIPEDPLPGVLDIRSMFFNSFLATPLLNLPPLPRELRITDKFGISQDEDKDTLIQAINAFTHAMYEDSDKTILVTDIQGMSANIQ